MDRTGVWIVGALGSLSTTVIAGARAIARGLSHPTGLLTERPDLQSGGWAPIDGLVFGGAEIRRGSLAESATEISKANGSISPALIQALTDDLQETSDRVCPGTALGCGPAIERLADPGPAPQSNREVVDHIVAELQSFITQTKVQRLVVVNLASTEPPVEETSFYRERASFEKAIEQGSVGEVRAGALYALAAFEAGAAYLNFTPSASALCPALEEIATDRGLPYMGNDGKTGETLVKTALAPMFRDRNLAVDSWVGFNILGNRDGEVLADEDNKRSKVETKDSVLSSILGYPLETKVGIDYVRSMGDQKVAWDHIHFRGFLDHAMSMEFTWRGCDSILAAPIVLDLIRFLDLSLRLGASGAQTHLAPFFKDPLHAKEHDLHRQYEALSDYLSQRTSP